jgi:hypothetical protein
MGTVWLLLLLLRLLRLLLLRLLLLCEGAHAAVECHLLHCSVSASIQPNHSSR